MRYMKKRAGIAVMIIAAVMGIGAIWQYIMERIDEDRYPAPGSYVSTEAYDMHYVSKGEGDIAIVFIEGSGTPCACTDFYSLQESLSRFGQTISFDHAGSGWSSSTNEPRTVENLETELTELLDAAAPEKQVLLICHSLGSLEAIYYAQTHPEKLRGIVFLDSGDPEFYRADSETAAKLLNRGTAFLRAAGFIRGLSAVGVPLPFYGEGNRLESLPEELRALEKAMLSRHAGSKETLKSVDEMNENAEKVVNGPRLGDLPILVLSSDSGEAWNIVQNTLAGWSSDSSQITIEHAEHYLHWSNPDEVREHIETFVETVLSKDFLD